MPALFFRAHPFLRMPTSHHWVVLHSLKEGRKMRHNILTKPLMAAALLILAIPLGASAQIYRDRYNDRYDYRDQYNRMDRRDVRDTMYRLENSSNRLESDLNYTPGRRVLGIFQF